MGIMTAGISKGIGAYDESSRFDIKKTINQLERRRENYEKQKELSGSPEMDEKLKQLEEKISNLEDKMQKAKPEQPGVEECETCKNRKYQDGSDDPGVSFKSAAKVGPEGAEAAVRGHEYEHVNRNRAKAAREDKEIVYQSVVIRHAICPECGKSYASGGTTTTVTRSGGDNKLETKFNVGLPGDAGEKGDTLDMVA